MYHAICIILYIPVLFWIYSLHKSSSPRPPSGLHRIIESFVEKLNRLIEDNSGERSDKPPMLSRYNFTFFITLLMRLFFWLVVPVLLLLLQHEIQFAIFRPDNAFAYSSNEGATIVFAAGAFTASIAFSNLIIPILNRIILRKSKIRSGKSDFQSKTASINIFRSGALLLIGVPLLMLSLYSYTYYTDQEINFQEFFTSETVRYDQIQYAETHWDQQANSLEYFIYYGAGNPPNMKRIYGGNIERLDIRQVDDTLIRNKVEVRRTPITQEQLETIERAQQVLLKELVVSLCGVRS